MFIVDRVPRPKLMAGGMIACVIVLTIECILIARNPIGPDVNPAALKAAVAMIFCRSTLHPMIQKTEAYTSNSIRSLLRVHEQRPARLPRRDLPVPPAIQGPCPGRVRDLSAEHYLVAGSPYGTGEYRVEVLSLLHHPECHHGCSDPNVLA